MSDKPREKVEVEPNPKDPAFFSWLESLFDGTTQFPEKLETRVVTGRHGERLGPMIKQIIFAPQAVEKKDDNRKDSDSKKPSRNAKPTREEIVAMSNQLLFLCQRDCDANRRPTTYGVMASHFLREVDFYERWLFHMKPKGAHAADGENAEDEDSEGGSIEKRYGVQKMHHDERMFNLYGAALEGLIDRYGGALERETVTNERLRSANERLLDMVEKLQSQEHQRKMDLQWQELKIKSVEKMADLAIGLAPPLLNQITGKKIVQTSETPESLTLKNFFKLETDGGKLTVAQADAAFGKYDKDNNLIKPGVLTPEQSKLLWDVAHCAVGVDELDRLLPGGPMEVKPEKLAELQSIFPMEQLAPIIALIGMRMQNRMASQGASAHQ